MTKIIWKVLIKISLEYGLYFWWARIYRKIWQKKYSGEVNPREKMIELEKMMSSKTWKSDKWRELGDAISYPRYFEEVSNSELGRDCDDFSVWCLSAGRDGVEKNGQHYYSEGLLSVVWSDGWRLKGHNVAVFGTYSCYTCKLSHISNWGFCDNVGNTYEDVARSICDAVGKNLVAWRLTSSDLKDKFGFKIYL